MKSDKGFLFHTQIHCTVPPRICSAVLGHDSPIPGMDGLHSTDSAFLYDSKAYLLFDQGTVPVLPTTLCATTIPYHNIQDTRTVTPMSCRAVLHYYYGVLVLRTVQLLSRSWKWLDPSQRIRRHPRNTPQAWLQESLAIRYQRLQS